jgi:hypothetical protein
VTTEAEMSDVRVYEPAMCCSTGVCGPAVDPELVRFAADLDWLKSQGVTVSRYNLSQQPGAFADDADVRSALEAKGEAGLPLLKVDGLTKAIGTYPSRADLAEWTGVDATQTKIRVELGTRVSACCPPKDSSTKGTGCC